MKYAVLVASFFLIVAFSPMSTVTFSSLRGTPESDAVLVQWSTSQEDGLSGFEVQKASAVDNQFYSLGSINAAGPGSTYQFYDRAIYKTASSAIFRYRVAAIGMDGSTVIAYSNIISVDFNYSSGLSGIASKTWGSIKAMFR